MYKKNFILIITLLSPFFVFSQNIGNNVSKPASDKGYYFDSDSVISKESTKIVKNKDSVSVDLMLVGVYGLPKFNGPIDEYYYNNLREKVFRVYPYFKIAVNEYKNVVDSLNLKNKTQKENKYLKMRQKQLSDKYEIQLKKLTKTEGRIFSKLMSRATGKTTFQIIKELRGGWSAFWWNVKAKAFDIDLDQAYEPQNNREDSYIETILLRAYQYGELRPVSLQ